MKVLNLFAGIGGNRRYWNYNNCKIVAIEKEPKIAEIYKKIYPDDIIIIDNAYKYLQKEIFNFDLIWASPPCETHSRARYWGLKSKNPVYPDLRLYEIIIFLKYYCKTFYVVENVMPFYKPLINYNVKIGRHIFWTNLLSEVNKEIYFKKKFFKDDIGKMIKEYNLDKNYFNNIDGKLKRKALRSWVNGEIGKFFWDLFLKKYQEVKNEK